MSDTSTAEGYDDDSPPMDPQLMFRLNHSWAQEKYRKQHLEDERDRARLGMRRVRSQRSTSEASHGRRQHDADYREKTRQRKFIATYGQGAFDQHYVPTLAASGGKHLTGVQWDWVGRAQKEELKALDQVIAGSLSVEERLAASRRRRALILTTPHLKNIGKAARAKRATTACGK